MVDKCTFAGRMVENEVVVSAILKWQKYFQVPYSISALCEASNRQRLAALEWKRHSYLGRYVEMIVDVRICNFTTEDGLKGKMLSYAVYHRCPNPCYGKPEILALKNPTGHYGLDCCMHEDFLNAKELISMIPGALECLACPDNRFRDDRNIKHARRFAHYLARCSFVFNSVLKLAEFFCIHENT